MSCSDQEKRHVGQDEQKPDIFPVNSFLAEQIHFVDSLQLPVFKYTTINEIKDSILISIQEFKILANEFMLPDITHPSLSRFYKETSFADQSIPNVTLTYSTSDKDLEVQRMDVIINPNPVLNDKVKSIYIEKISKRNDTSWQKNYTGNQINIFRLLHLANRLINPSQLARRKWFGTIFSADTFSDFYLQQK